MRVFTLIGLLAGLTLMNVGCYTPGYSAEEHYAQIGRNWDYEGKQAADDLDNVMLLRPASHMTLWNVQ